MVGGATVRPDVCPQPTLGPQSDWCVPYLPLSQRQDSLWSGVAPVWATCTLPGLWCCFYGIWCISWGGSTRCTGVGGADSAHFAFSGRLQEGPCGTGREADPSEGWIHQSIVLGVCAVQASSLLGTGSLGILAGGWVREMVLPSTFVPCRAELSSRAQHLSLLVSSHHPALQAELLTYNIPDVMSRWLSELTQSGPSAFASQTLGALSCWAGCPSTAPPPSRQSV